MKIIYLLHYQKQLPSHLIQCNFPNLRSGVLLILQIQSCHRKSILKCICTFHMVHNDSLNIFRLNYPHQHNHYKYLHHRNNQFRILDQLLMALQEQHQNLLRLFHFYFYHIPILIHSFRIFLLYYLRYLVILYQVFCSFIS